MTLVEIIKELQKELNEDGYGLTVDGVFGPKTEAALKEATRPKVKPVPKDGEIRFCILVGHSRADGGATLNHQAFRNEYEYNTKTAELMVAYAKAKYPQVVTKVIFRDGIGRSGALSQARAFKPDATIELHFNAANKSATGTLTLTTSESVDKSYAGFIQSAMCKVFGRSGNSRGLSVLSAGGRGYTNVNGLPGSANCLVEPFFGDAPLDAALGVRFHREYAECLVDATVDWVSR